ncbi:MAG: hypothetical protein K2X03_28110 [Bryobacteraceae bacterium]|nr:hypothetical protein [Bryobacteraceae bacterium]
MNLDYLNQHSMQTLRAALAELRAAEGIENDAAAQVAPELANDLDVHDAIHVIFGCSTDVGGEVLAHVWTLLGTTAKMRDLHRVMSHADHREALARIGHRSLLRKWITTLPLIAATAYRASRMTRRLPVDHLPSLLDRPLDEIRRSFGIRIPRRDHTPVSSAGAAVRHVRKKREISVA